MTGSPRRPESCEHRIVVGPGESSCGLAKRVLGEVPPAALRTDDLICRECCRRSLAAGPRLNPVVASLVFSAATVPPPAELPASEFVSRHWAREFAVTSLESAPTAGRRTAALPARTPRMRRQQSHEPPLLGLVGPNSRFGLGHVNRDIARHLRVDRWLITRRPGEPEFPLRELPCRVQSTDLEDSDVEIAAWLRGLDAVLFVETPYLPGLCRCAREHGVLVICVPMWEWLHPGLEWLADVDVMLCPTRRTATLLEQWKRRFGFQWNVESLPWPIDPDAFTFRRRFRCEQFVYVHGSGGFKALRSGLESEIIERKGFSALLQAAREVPRIPVIVYGPGPRTGRTPPNVEFRPPPENNRDLYAEGDVCLQPSLWEGLGLPLLECQAAGMPLITTDLPPMNEHKPLAVIPAREVSARLKPDLWIPAADICPEDLARVMRDSHRRWIPFASGRARRYIVRERNWRNVRGSLSKAIATWVGRVQNAQ